MPSTLKVDVIHIKSRGTKHGRGRRGDRLHEWAQAAVGGLRDRGELPQGTSKSRMVQRVLRELRKNPSYRELERRRGKAISRNTILSAAVEQGVLKPSPPRS